MLNQAAVETTRLVGKQTEESEAAQIAADASTVKGSSAAEVVAAVDLACLEELKLSGAEVARAVEEIASGDDYAGIANEAKSKAVGSVGYTDAACASVRKVAVTEASLIAAVSRVNQTDDRPRRGTRSIESDESIEPGVAVSRILGTDQFNAQRGCRSFTSISPQNLSFKLSPHVPAVRMDDQSNHLSAATGNASEEEEDIFGAIAHMRSREFSLEGEWPIQDRQRLLGAMTSICRASLSPAKDSDRSTLQQSVSHPDVLRIVLTMLRCLSRCDDNDSDLVTLGLDVLRNTCEYRSGCQRVFEIEDSIDVVTSCLQLFRDVPAVFSRCVDIMDHMTSDNSICMQLSRMLHVVARLRNVLRIVVTNRTSFTRYQDRLFRTETLLAELARVNGTSEIIGAPAQLFNSTLPDDEAIEMLTSVCSRVAA
jgi:hypothetical protein